MTNTLQAPTPTPTPDTKLATTSPASPANALATALHLAEMNPEQLASASKSLLAAEERYDRMSGICATLNGLVLLEAKRQIAHGNFMQWVQDATGHSDRDARRRMRIAEEFIASLSKSKTDTRVRFENAQQLLLDNFTELLSADAASPMDESNPVFAAVAQYVDGRSYRALADALPKPRMGGARVKDPNKPYDPNAPIENARDLLLHPLRAVMRRWNEKEAKLPLWTHLPPEELREIDGMLLDLRTDLKAALKTA
jgi:hypothetical protein